MQIAALNVRSEADAIAKRLSSKGYAAYVLRAGERHAVGVPRPRRQVPDAPRSRDRWPPRLQKEEQFKPWVTR